MSGFSNFNPRRNPMPVLPCEERKDPASGESHRQMEAEEGNACQMSMGKRTIRDSRMKLSQSQQSARPV
ncbi:hypothetical protein PBY51_017078 [Eleginops maclovinus]|uniref:Uncharacterized protein n=1 Tax=Eleginops maclovinus TaxID=56733 RepID=A0AAN8A077_ELEMC|nr:hypothetical protein PBY51_017078 [Eleginops maclovinus]